jgi:alkylation response protein AidB-like acyl-CoA dehydrogenase
MQELQEIRTLAREFAQSELRPHVEAWDRDASFGEQTLGQVAELGFFGMLAPDAHGGMGFDLPTYVVALEQLAWGEASVALVVAHATFAAQLVEQLGSDEQKRGLLEQLARGALVPAIALAEAESGADLGRISTRAERDGSAWVLNGAKSWVSNAERADLLLVLAATPDGNRLFVLPRESGWKTGARAQTLGLRPLALSNVELANVRATQEQVLGAPTIDETGSITGALGNLSIAAISLGIAQAALDHAVGYADEREQFARKLRDFEGLQFKLAEMVTRTEAARSLLQRAAAEGGALTNMAKLFASETAMWVTTNAVQIFGGYGYMRDYPVEKLMRDAKAMELLEGTNELQRVRIAEALYE